VIDAHTPATATDDLTVLDHDACTEVGG